MAFYLTYVLGWNQGTPSVRIDDTGSSRYRGISGGKDIGPILLEVNHFRQEVFQPDSIDPDIRFGGHFPGNIRIAQPGQIYTGGDFISYHIAVIERIVIIELELTHIVIS